MEVKGGDQHKSESGMMRNKEDAKIDYSLALDGPMFERLAIHLTKALVHYKPRNWMLASTHEDLERFRRGAVRHFYQWLRGDTDEDHAAAVMFNINGYEYVKIRMGVSSKRMGPC